MYRTFRNPACGKAAPYPPLYCSQRPRYANIDVFSGRSANHVGICFGFLYSIVGFNTRYHALSRKLSLGLGGFGVVIDLLGQDIVKIVGNIVKLIVIVDGDQHFLAVFHHGL